MKRLTTNKDVSEMSMIELAHNSCYAKDNKARYRDYDTDIDARELIKKLLDKFADIPNEFTCDDDFDDFILDYAQYGTDNILGLIAIFYKNLWAMADLRERLAEYEDIGLLPEQIIEVDRLYAEKCKELAELQKRYLSGMELKKLEEYRGLEEQGKLMKLPCVVGDSIYIILGNYQIQKSKVDKFKMIVRGWAAEAGGWVYLFEEFGKTVFLTQEEAEAALRKMNETEKSK